MENRYKWKKLKEDLKKFPIGTTPNDIVGGCGEVNEKTLLIIKEYNNWFI